MIPEISREKIPFDKKVCPIFMFTTGKKLSEFSDKSGEVLGVIIHQDDWNLSTRDATHRILPQVENTIAICEACKNNALHQPQVSFASLSNPDGTTSMFAGIVLDDDIGKP